MIKILDPIAQFHNWLSDKDFIWWPFSFLRPAPQEMMSFKLTLTMASCFGGLTFVMFSVMAIMNNAFSFNYAFSVLVSCFFGFLLWFNCITKPLWNHRAKKLLKNHKNWIGTNRKPKILNPNTLRSLGIPAGGQIWEGEGLVELSRALENEVRQTGNPKSEECIDKKRPSLALSYPSLEDPFLTVNW